MVYKRNDKFYGWLDVYLPVLESSENISVNSRTLDGRTGELICKQTWNVTERGKLAGWNFRAYQPALVTLYLGTGTLLLRFTSRQRSRKTGDFFELSKSSWL